MGKRNAVTTQKQEKGSCYTINYYINNGYEINLETFRAIELNVLDIYPEMTEGWYETYTKQSQAMRDYIADELGNNKYHMYHEDEIDDTYKEIAGEVGFGNWSVDTYNPRDCWLVKDGEYDNILSQLKGILRDLQHEKFNNLKDGKVYKLCGEDKCVSIPEWKAINAKYVKDIFLDLFRSKKLIAVSLKKVGANSEIEVEEVNTKENGEVPVVDVTFSSLYIPFEMNDLPDRRYACLLKAKYTNSRRLLDTLFTMYNNHSKIDTKQFLEGKVTKHSSLLGKFPMSMLNHYYNEYKDSTGHIVQSSPYNEKNILSKYDDIVDNMVNNLECILKSDFYKKNKNKIICDREFTVESLKSFMVEQKQKILNDPNYNWNFVRVNSLFLHLGFVHLLCRIWDAGIFEDFLINLFLGCQKISELTCPFIKLAEVIHPTEKKDNGQRKYKPLNYVPPKRGRKPKDDKTKIVK